MPNTEPVDEELRHRFQQVIGSLLYIMLGTRPDIAFAVTKLSQHAANPSKEHLQKALYICHYLAGTPHYKLVYNGSKLLSLAPAPVKRTTGGMGKSWEPAPEGDFRFCQYVTPRVAHRSGRCDCMSSPSPFSPTR
jgi:hypothetical protein